MTTSAMRRCDPRASGNAMDRRNVLGSGSLDPGLAVLNNVEVDSNPGKYCALRMEL